MWDQTRNAFLAALEGVLQTMARLVPGLLVMLVLLMLSVLIAVVASALVRRVCARLKVDQQLRQWGMAAPAQEGRAGPSALAARLVAWTVVLVGTLVGLSAVDSSRTSALALRLLDLMPDLLVALFIGAAGLAASRALERNVLIEAVNMGSHSARLLGVGARWLLVLLASALALGHLGIGGTILTAAFSIVFGGIVLSLSLAVGLGARDMVARSLERRFQEPVEQKAPPPEPVHHL